MKFGQHAERPGLSDAFERLHNERLHRDEGVSFRVGVAATDWQFTQAHALVSRQYRRAGYLEPQAPSSSSASPLVALALRNTLGGGGESQALGTVALRCDGPSGLLADEQYRSTLDVMRAQGSRLAECGRLAVDAAAPFITVLGQLVRTVAHIAREERNVTDVVALCHPRHAHFYCRTLGFARLGELSFCQYVG
ncbi:MAG TPA: hypothetical protein VFW00_14680, partial [Rhodocyclaceae bacterium]|nr:hypothetical protein [Rhodocyclaceae bacterium]